MAYYIIDRARINFQPAVTTTAGYPGINTSGGFTNIVNDILQVFNISSGTTIGGGGISLPTPKIILDDKYFIENGNYYEVDLYDKTANTIGNQIQFLKNIKINTSDFTQDFLDNNLVYIEMMIYKRRNQRTIFPTNYNTFSSGYNLYGQLGDGTNTDSLVQINVTNDQDYRKISAGANHSVVIDENNDVLTFGFNQYYQLGDGTTTNSNIPINVQNNIKEIFASDAFTHAIDENGDIWSWGFGEDHRLGFGDELDKTIPTLHNSLPVKFQKITNGNSNGVLALDENGNVWATGANYSGQLSYPNPTTPSIPGTAVGWTQLTGLTTTFKDISTCVAGGHSLAIDSDGNIWSCGENTSGQLGTSDNNQRIIFTKITIPNTKFIQVAVGGNHSLALDENGNVWSSGGNSQGQLGNNNNTDTNTFQQIFGNIKFKKISANFQISAAIDIYGYLWFWGVNTFGRFGDGNSGNNSNVPVQLNNTIKYFDVSLGIFHTLAITKSKGTNPIANYTKSSYVVPSPHYVTSNYDYPAWGASFWTRSGMHVTLSAGTYLEMEIDRPNHFKVENVNDLIDVTDYFNGRFEEIDIQYRDTTGALQTYNTVIPNCNGSKRAGAQTNNRFSYSSKYSNLYCAFRYVVFDPTANLGRGQIFAGPISKTVKIAHQYQPFIDDYNANISVNAPTAYINPNHDKYKFLPRIETKLP